MLTERQTLGKIEILEDGQIQLREDTIIERDGKEINRTYHRRGLDPGLGHSETNERLVAIINVVWTQEVIYARKEFLKELAKKSNG